MENHFKIGDMVYFLESNVNVIPVEVIRIAGGFCIIRFPDGKSGTKVRKSKIFQNKSSRRNFPKLRNFDLSHHRTYGSVYGGFKFILKVLY